MIFGMYNNKKILVIALMASKEVCIILHRKMNIRKNVLYFTQ